MKKKRLKYRYLYTTFKVVKRCYTWSCLTRFSSSEFYAVLRWSLSFFSDFNPPSKPYNYDY